MHRLEIAFSRFVRTVGWHRRLLAAGLAAGAVADLVLFDPVTVRDASTYDDPTAAAVGVETVLVGGAVAVDDGRPVRPSLGRVLRPEVSGPRRPRRS